MSDDVKTTKVCCDCNTEKTLSDFYKFKKMKDGLYRWCKKCHSKRCTESRRKKYKKGICADCQKSRMTSSNYCDLHCVRNMLSKIPKVKIANIENSKYLLEKFYNNPYCPYTGEELKLGVNASLDHIYPRKHYPNLSDKLENLEWVSWEANSHKSDLTKKDFINLCHKVVDNLENKK